MTRRWGWTVGGLMAALLACPSVSASPAGEMDTTSELIRLADVVRFLRRRVLAERPELLADQAGQVAAFRAELARLDLDPPDGVPLDVRVDDLNLAGLLLEEQLRRRRTARRRSLLDETAEVFQVPGRSASGVEPVGDSSSVPEVARLFSAIREERGKVPPLPGPHPAGGIPEAASPVPSVSAPSASSEPPEPDDTTLARELAEVGAKLRAALARVDAAAPVRSDPRYGDRNHRVSGVERAEPVEVTEPVDLTGPVEIADPVEVARVLPAPTPRKPDLDTRKMAVPVEMAVPVKVAPSAAPPAKAAPAKARPEVGVAAVLAQVLPLVQGQGVSPAEFPAVMSATLATFGVQVPGDFRPRPEDSPQAMARELVATSGGHVDVAQAVAALGI